MNWFHRFLKQEKGVALVEMAVVMPFVFILSLGIFEFGNVLYQHHLIATGIRDAGRWLARYPVEAGGPESGEAQAKQIALTGEIVGGTKRVSWWNVADITINIVPISNPIDPGTGERTYRGEDPIKIIRVSTTGSYSGLGFLDFLGIGPELVFSLSHEERYMGR